MKSRALAELASSGAVLLSGYRVFDAPAPKILHALNESETVAEVVALQYDRLIVATGARERFLPFPGWQSLVGFITSATVLMYAGAPLALGALRRQKPDAPRPFRLRAGEFWAPVAFVVSNLIIYWTGWQVVWKLDVAVLLGYALMAISRETKANAKAGDMDWASAIWLWPYLAGMALLSFLGQFGGGRAVLPFWWDMVVVAAFSLVIYALAIHFRLPDAKVDEYTAQVFSVED